MRRSILFVCLFIAVATLPSHGQAKKPPVTVGSVGHARDVGGWDKIKWGMSIAEVKALYGTEVHDSAETETGQKSKYVERLTMRRMIADFDMKVSIQISLTSGKVKEVLLSPFDGVEGHGGSYNDLSDALIHKYGTPTSSRADEYSPSRIMVTHSMKWIFSFNNH